MSWEMVNLGDVLYYEQPTNYIVSSDIYSDDFTMPVLTAGKSFLLGYTNETHGVYSNLPAIIFDDFTTDSKYVDFPFKVKSSAMKILKAKEDAADIRFMFYLLQTLNVDREQHKRYWISKFAPLQIPLPPLPVQKRIAEILDAADALKRKDYELLKKYDQLAQAIFIDMFGDPVKNEKGWEVKKLGDLQVTKSQNGLYVTQENYTKSGGVEMVHMSDAFYGVVKQGSLKRVLISESEIEKYKLTEDSILVARRSLNYEGAVKPCLIQANNNSLVYESSLIRIVVDKSKLLPLYLFYFLGNGQASAANDRETALLQTSVTEATGETRHYLPVFLSGN